MRGNKMLWLGLLGSILGCIADVFLLYHPSGHYLDPHYSFLKEISYPRLLAGHYIGILAIPLELIGFHYLIHSVITPRSRAYLFFFLSCSILIAGVAYHGIIGIYSTIIKEVELGPSTTIQLKSFFEPLGYVLFLGFTILSASIFYYIYRGYTPYPKSYAWVNPFLFYLAIFLLYISFPLVGNLLIVAGFNLSILLFFAFYQFIAHNKDCIKIE